MTTTGAFRHCARALASVAPENRTLELSDARWEKGTHQADVRDRSLRSGRSRRRENEFCSVNGRKATSTSIWMSARRSPGQLIFGSADSRTNASGEHGSTPQTRKPLLARPNYQPSTSLFTKFGLRSIKKIVNTRYKRLETCSSTLLPSHIAARKRTSTGTDTKITRILLMLQLSSRRNFWVNRGESANILS